MRMHIEMDDDLVAAVDAVAGRRGRSRFVRDAVTAAVESARRAELVRSARGSIPDTGHGWDDSPAAWVHHQRHSDTRRTG